MTYIKAVIHYSFILAAYLNQRISNLVVELFSSLVDVVGPVKGELFGWLVHSAGLVNEALAPAHVHGQHHLTAESLLPVIQRPAPHHHLHRL